MSRGLNRSAPVTPPAICPRCLCLVPTSVSGGRVYFARHLNVMRVTCERPIGVVPEPVVEVLGAQPGLFGVTR